MWALSRSLSLVNGDGVHRTGTLFLFADELFAEALPELGDPNRERCPVTGVVMCVTLTGFQIGKLGVRRLNVRLAWFTEVQICDHG